jgi:hypothetical protein
MGFSPCKHLSRGSPCDLAPPKPRSLFSGFLFPNPYSLFPASSNPPTRTPKSKYAAKPRSAWLPSGARKLAQDEVLGKAQRANLAWPMKVSSSARNPRPPDVTNAKPGRLIALRTVTANTPSQKPTFEGANPTGPRVGSTINPRRHPSSQRGSGAISCQLFQKVGSL